MQKSRQLGRAEAGPSPSRGGGHVDPGKPLQVRFPSVSREGSANLAQKKDTVLQAIVCASQILLTPQLLVKRNERL